MKVFAGLPLALLRWLACLAVLGLAPAWPAHAEELLLETMAWSDRAEARQVAEALAEAGYDSARVVRRFSKGAGWEHVVRIEGIEERDVALSTAEAVAAVVGGPVTVFVGAGRDLLPMAEIRAPTEPGEADTAEPASGAGVRDPVGGQVLHAAVIRAHGAGVAGNAVLTDAPVVHFRFERQVTQQGGVLRVWHDYWRRGDDRRLEVRVLEGEGVDSLTVVRAGEGAWLGLGGESHEVEPGPSLEALDAFEPARVLGRALDFGAMPATDGVYLLHSDPGEDARLVLEGDAEGTWHMIVDRTDHRVRELTLALGEETLTWRFADYRELDPGLVVPFRLEVWREQELRERVSVHTLEVLTEAEDTLFHQGQGQEQPEP